MDYTKLFDFQFVDRDQARTVFRKFMSEVSNEILWIYGNTGVGKTSLVNHVVQQNPQIAYCYIDVSDFENDSELISTFIEKIQSISDKGFLYSIQKYFKAFYDKESSKILKLTSEQFPKVSTISSILLDAGFYVLTQKNEKRNSAETVTRYIREVLKSKNLFVCVDNFSRSSKKVFDFFSFIFKKCANDENLKCCIITNTDCVAQQKVERRIFSETAFEPIHLTGLEKAEHFYQILDLIFQMDSLPERDVLKLFDKCGGNPHVLSTIILKLIEKDGIITHEGAKPEIDRSILQSILNHQYIALNEQDFSAIEKWVLFSYYSAGKKTSLNRLKDLANFISAECFLFSHFGESTIGEAILHLVDIGILSIKESNVETSISVFETIKELYEQSNIKELFSSCVYKYYYSHPEYPESFQQKCYHAFIAHVPHWEDINYQLGEKLFEAQEYEKSAEVFRRITDTSYCLPTDKQLLVGKCFYETGSFSEAVRQLEKINISDLHNQSNLFDYYVTLGKGFNTIGNVVKACEVLENALHVMNEDSIEYVYLLDLLQMYYCEIPGKEKMARSYFFKIKNNYKESYPILWANTMRGCQNYFRGDKALKVLREAEEKLVDPADKAFISNTKGFILVRMGRIADAKQLFAESSETILQIKPHEYSYAANNLAVCHIIQEDYIEAKNILIKALLWNSTVYGNIAIKTHLMIVSAHLDELTECKNYMEDLKAYIKQSEPSDRIILRKIYMNLSIANNIIGEADEAKLFLELASAYVNNTSSQKIYEAMREIQNDGQNVECGIPAFDPWFLIYAHD